MVTGKFSIPASTARLGRVTQPKKQQMRAAKQLPARSCKNKNMKGKTFKQREIERRDDVATKELEKALREAGKEKRIAIGKKKAEKKKRKELNEVKAGQYQVIKDTSKIRNWNKKAKRQLVKMSEEQVAGLLLRKGRNGLSKK